MHKPIGQKTKRQKLHSTFLGSARNRPRREAADRPLDGEDRSGIVKNERKGELQRTRLTQTNGFATIRSRTCFQGFRRCETVLQNTLVLQYHYAMLIGYARVSTDDQDTSAQVTALEAAGCERHASGTHSGRSRYRPSGGPRRRSPPQDALAVDHPTLAAQLGGDAPRDAASRSVHSIGVL